MYVVRKDMEILISNEVMELKRQYREKFGEFFMYFNYADFPGSKEQTAGEMYRETLRKALESDKPYHVVSHRYDDFDH